MDRTWTEIRAASKGEKNKRPFQKRRAKKVLGVIPGIKNPKKNVVYAYSIVLIQTHSKTINESQKRQADKARSRKKI